MARGRTELERLLDPAATEAFLAAVRRAADGEADLGLEPPGAGTAGHARSITVEGRGVASLRAGGGIPEAFVELAAAGLELAAREAAGRRAVAIEALEAYRELALLYRLSERIGALLDPATIGPAVLDEARRVLRADAAAIVPVGPGPRAGVGPRVPPSSTGDPRAVLELLASARPWVERATASAADAAALDARSIVVAPLPGTGGPRAVMVLGRDRPAYTSGEVKLVVALAQQAAIAFERTALHAANADRLRLEHDLALGRRIQLGMLPQRLPRTDGWEIGAVYEPAREVGGDFYDVFPLRGRSRSIGLVIADVTGKGIPAALMMAFARPLLRAASDHSAGPAEALARANRVLVEERRAALFVTALHLRLHLRSGTLTWAAAGHEPPLLLPAGGARVRRLPAGGTLLGARIDPECAEHETRLAPGDLVVAYTDGITDARRDDGTRFGEERLMRAVRAAAGLTAAEAARAIAEDVHRFTGGAPRADDLALLTLRRVPRRRARRVASGAAGPATGVGRPPLGV